MLTPLAVHENAGGRGQGRDDRGDPKQALAFSRKEPPTVSEPAADCRSQEQSEKLQEQAERFLPAPVTALFLSHAEHALRPVDDDFLVGAEHGGGRDRAGVVHDLRLTEPQKAANRNPAASSSAHGELRVWEARELGLAALVEGASRSPDVISDGKPIRIDRPSIGVRCVSPGHPLDADQTTEIHEPSDARQEGIHKIGEATHGGNSRSSPELVNRRGPG